MTGFFVRRWLCAMVVLGGAVSCAKVPDWNDPRLAANDGPVGTTRLAVGEIPSPANFRAVLLGSRQIQLSWENAASYINVNIYRVGGGEAPVVACPPGSSGSCFVDSPNGAETADTRIFFVAEGCSAQFCSLMSNQAWVDLRRPAAPESLVATLGTDGEVHFEWTDKESYFQVLTIFIDRSDGVSAPACFPDRHDSCVTNAPAKAGSRRTLPSPATTSSAPGPHPSPPWSSSYGLPPT
jgi:hypothetical protein